MISFFEYALGVLAVWRVTHLLYAEDGPWGIVVRLREKAGVSFWGELLDCFHCLSLWIALPLSIWLGNSFGQRLLLWLALSAGAIIVERILDSAPLSPVAVVIEEEEPSHGMLRATQESAEAEGANRKTVSRE
jgi:hypothetical protein